MATHPDVRRPLPVPAQQPADQGGDRWPTLQLFYDLDRGLPAESYGIPFGSVCAGIFIESVAVAAHGFGFELVERLDYSPMRFDSTQRLHRLGSLTLVPTQAAPPDSIRT